MVACSVSWLNISDVLSDIDLSAATTSSWLSRSIVVVTAEWVEHMVSSALNASAEAVVVTRIVVVTHLAFWFVFFDFGSSSLLVDDDVFTGSWSMTLVFYFVRWLNLTAVFSFSDIDLGLVWTILNDV